MTRVLLLLVLVGGLALGWQLWRRGDGRTERQPAPDAATASDRIGDLPASRFLIDHDRFIAATDPRHVAAADATFLRDDDEVFGIEWDGEARAYAVTMLAYYHVVNDRLHGRPIAVTY